MVGGQEEGIKEEDFRRIFPRMPGLSFNFRLDFLNLLEGIGGGGILKGEDYR